jgi:hypothetical protein
LLAGKQLSLLTSKVVSLLALQHHSIATRLMRCLQ